MTVITKMKTRKLSLLLISLLAFAGFGLIAGYTFAADEPLPVTDGDVLLNPFTLTIYQPQNLSSATDDSTADALSPATEFYGAMMATTSDPITARSPVPIATLRPWVMVPYRPPLRSPFLPW